MAKWAVRRVLDMGGAVNAVCFGRDGALYGGLKEGCLGVAAEGWWWVQRVTLPLEGAVLQLSFFDRGGGLLAAADTTGTVALLQPQLDGDFLEIGRFTTAAAPSALDVLVDGVGDYSVLAASHMGELRSYVPFSNKFSTCLQDLEAGPLQISCLAILPAIVPVSMDDGEVVDERVWLLCCSDGKVRCLTPTGTLRSAFTMPNCAVPTSAVAPPWRDPQHFFLMTAEDGFVYSMALREWKSPASARVAAFAFLDYPLTKSVATNTHLICIGQSNVVTIVGRDGAVVCDVSLPCWPVAVAACPPKQEAMEEVAIATGSSIFVLEVSA